MLCVGYVCVRTRMLYMCIRGTCADACGGCILDIYIHACGGHRTNMVTILQFIKTGLLIGLELTQQARGSSCF